MPFDAAAETVVGPREQCGPLQRPHAPDAVHDGVEHAVAAVGVERGAKRGGQPLCACTRGEPEHRTDRGDGERRNGEPVLAERDGDERSNDARHRERLGPLVERPTTRRSGAVRLVRAVDLRKLVRREDRLWVEASLHRDERLANHRVELRPEVPLDLTQRFIRRDARPIRPVSRHRVV